MFLSLAMALGVMEKILYRVCPEAALGAIEEVSDGAGEASAGVVLVVLPECRATHPGTWAQRPSYLRPPAVLA